MTVAGCGCGLGVLGRIRSWHTRQCQGWCEGPCAVGPGCAGGCEPGCHHSLHPDLSFCRNIALCSGTLLLIPPHPPSAAEGPAAAGCRAIMATSANELFSTINRLMPKLLDSAEQDAAMTGGFSLHSVMSLI